jgi:IS1 family transposase
LIIRKEFLRHYKIKNNNVSTYFEEDDILRIFNCWIWIAVDRNKKRFVDCVLGSRDAEKKLWDSVRYLATGKVMSDYCKAYEYFIPKVAMPNIDTTLILY